MKSGILALRVGTTFAIGGAIAAGTYEPLLGIGGGVGLLLLGCANFCAGCIGSVGLGKSLRGRINIDFRIIAPQWNWTVELPMWWGCLCFGFGFVVSGYGFLLTIVSFLDAAPGPWHIVAFAVIYGLGAALGAGAGMLGVRLIQASVAAFAVAGAVGGILITRRLYSSETVETVCISVIYAVGGLLLGLAIDRLRKTSTVTTKGECNKCGYLLVGLPTTGHRCPECGTSFEISERIFLADSLGLRPGRVASFSIPAIRFSANRFRHSCTVGREMPSSAAMSWFR